MVQSPSKELLVLSAGLEPAATLKRSWIQYGGETWCADQTCRIVRHCLRSDRSFRAVRFLHAWMYWDDFASTKVKSAVTARIQGNFWRMMKFLNAETHSPVLVMKYL